MYENNYQNIKKELLEFLENSYEDVREILSFINITHDYCCYNLSDDVSANIMIIMEYLRDKLENLADEIDTRTMKFFNEYKI